MAVSINDRYIRTVASASQTVFTYDFPITEISDIAILFTDAGTLATTTLIYAVDYTLTGIGSDTGGTFILTSAAIANDIYVAYGATPYARATDFSGNTEVTTAGINTDYNEQEKQIQQLARDVGRSLKFPLEDNILTAVSELPVAADRANMYPFFDNDGNLTINSGTTGAAGAGGANTQIQYNDSGILDGDSGFTTNGSGSIDIVGDLDIDNININANTIISTNVNGDISITPNGTGIVDLSGSTGAMKFPSGTTAQRPASPDPGYDRYNTTLNVKEYYDGSTWITQEGGSGDVEGPGISTDNAIARFNGIGGTLIQNSGVIISDLDAVSGVTSLNINATTTINGVIDDDTMATASATTVPTSESVKNYADDRSMWRLISTATASSSPTIDFTGLSTTYFYYSIIIDMVIPATDGASLYMLTSSNNGSSYDNSAGNYWYAVQFLSASTGVSSPINSASADLINISGQLGNDTNEHGDFIIDAINPAGTSITSFSWRTVKWTASGDKFHVSGSGERISAATVNALRFIMSSGNIASGTFKLYGLKAL